MRMRSAVLACLALAMLVPTIRAEEDDGKKAKLWIVDFAKAKKMATDDNRDILMEFTGSDWCPPCKKLKAEVFDKKVFQEKAPKHFVLLKLDNPRDKSKQSDEEQAQYKELSKKFKITGVPTIILADSKGRPYAKLVGYGGQAAEKYVDNLVEKTAARKARDEHFAKAEKAEGVEKAKHLDKAISGIDSELALTTYRDTIDEIIKLDSKDEAKLKSKYEQMAKLTDIKAELAKLQRSALANPEKAIDTIDEMIEKQKLTGEAFQEAAYIKAFLLFRSEKKDESRELLVKAKEAAPKTQRATQIDRLLSTVFKEEEKKDDPKKDEPKEEPKKDDN